MVRLDGVDDVGRFVVLAGKLNAELDVAALHLVVDRLAEVMQQAGALGQRHVHAELAGQQTGDVGDLDGVVQNVLTIGRAVLLAAEQLDELGVEVVDAGLKRGAFALLLDDAVDLLAGLLYEILDTGRDGCGRRRSASRARDARPRGARDRSMRR